MSRMVLYIFFLGVLIFWACSIKTPPVPLLPPTVSPEVKKWVQRQYQAGIKAYDHGKLEVALTFFDQGIAKEDSFALPYFGRGMVFLKKQQFEEAKEAFTLAISKGGHFHKAYHGLGIIQRRMGQFHEAEKSYLAALKHNKNNDVDRALVYYNLGILSEVYLNDKPSALKFYQEYIKIAPEGISEDIQRVKSWIEMLEKSLTESSLSASEP